MSTVPKYLSKRKCSFKPTSTVRALLTELDSLLNLLDKNSSVEDFINEALQSHLPTVILTLRNELYAKNNLERIIEELEQRVKNIAKDESKLEILQENIDMNISTEEKENNEETEIEEINVGSVKNRLNF